MSPDKGNVILRNSRLILIGYATAFFPRLLTSFGAPSIINFFHFTIVTLFSIIAVLSSKVRDKKQQEITLNLFVGMAFFLFIVLLSAITNFAGLPNIFIQYLLQIEGFLFLAAIIVTPFTEKSLSILKKYVLSFALFNLLLALAQSVLLPLGLYPKPQGGTIQDNITGVFGGGGGSAANYVSCTISFYFALYLFSSYKRIPLWIKITVLLSSCYQIQVSDSKQVFMTLAFGYGVLLLTKIQNPVKIALYIVFLCTATFIIGWILLNLDWEILSPYQNWINRDIWGFDGLASRTKFAAIRILPTYFSHPFHWLIGLGPGHTVTRLGGWVFRDYKSLLVPLGATIHPATQAVWDVVKFNYLPKESTVYFPLFTWVGIWGDFGFLGLFAYFYLCSIVWSRLCIDDFGKFLLTSTAIFGLILTQMEEPGQFLSVALLIGIRWHETKLKKSVFFVIVPS